MSEIQRLAKVLGLPVDIEHIEAIVKVTGFDKMKAVKEQLVEKLLRPQFKKRWQGGKLDIFRKGLYDIEIIEPRHEKTCLRVLRPGKTQSSLLSYTD